MKKNIMKKGKMVLMGLLAVCLCSLALAGCSSTENPASSGASDTTTPQTTGTEPNQTQPADTDPTTTAPTDTTTEPTTEPTEPTTDPTEPTTPTEPTDPTEPTEPTTPTEPTEPTEPTSPSGDTGTDIANLAQSLVGTTYEYGATGPDTFDNSGLVYYCYRQNGITIPRMTGNMYASGTEVAQADLKPGDVVFFSVDKEGQAQYAGIYLGNNQFVASNNETNPTKIYDMTMTYFSSRYVGARRFA